MTSKNANINGRQENSPAIKYISGGHSGPPAFAAVLTPYRSLSKTGFVILMAIVSISCLVSGVFFLVAGAWPVMIMMGLDVLAIWLAFKLNYRSARRYEKITVWCDELIIRKVSPSGKTNEFSFNPYRAKFPVGRHEEFGVTAMKLREAGRELELGSFLNPDDRKSFASAFTAALADVRR